MVYKNSNKAPKKDDTTIAQEDEDHNETDQTTINISSIPLPMTKREKLFFLARKLSLFFGLLAMGNYCYFGPEKACKYESDEDCLKYFVEPIKQEWALTGVLSCVAFFLVVYIFLVMHYTKKYFFPEKEEEQQQNTQVHHHSIEDLQDTKLDNLGTAKNDQNIEQKQLISQNNEQSEPQDMVSRFKKYEKLLGVIALINQLSIQLFASKYIDPMNYHGVFKFAFTIIISILWILFGIILLGFVIYRKVGKKFIVGLIAGFFILTPYFYFTKVLPSCDHWLEGTYQNVNQDNGNCQIVVPNYCWFNVMGGIFDFNRFHTPCNKRSYEPDYEYIAAYISNPYSEQNRIFDKQYKFIGYPDTSKFSPEQRQSTHNHKYSIQKQILDEAVFYTNLESAKYAGHEIIVNIEKQTTIYNVQKNQDLIDERKALNKQSTGIADNVVVIFIDAVSRRNAYRQLPKTVKYLAKSQPQFYEYFRYHSLRRSTAENLIQFFYNSRHPMQHPEDYKNQKQKEEMIFEKIKQQGYITMHSSDLCQTKSLQFGGSINEYFQNNAMDHEGFSLACHPKHQNPKNPLGMFEGPNSTIRRCFLQKSSAEHVFDYSLEFKKQYKGEKTFQYLEFLDAHEASSEHLKYMDDNLADYLEKIDDENTMIMLVSDHGHHMSEWTVFSPALQDQLHLEMALPMLFIKTPENNRMNEFQKTQLGVNQQSFFTMANLYHTLREATGIPKKGEKDQETPSLFEQMSADQDCMNSHPRINLTGVECACRNPY